VADGQDRLAHLLIVGRVEAEEYRPGGGSSNKRRTVNRAAHGQALRGQVVGAFDAGDLARDEIDDDELRATGSIIVVEGADAINPLKLESLDRARGEALRTVDRVGDAVGVDLAETRRTAVKSIGSIRHAVTDAVASLRTERTDTAG